MKRGSRFYAAAFTNPTPPAMATLWAGEVRARRFLSAWDRQCRRLRLLFGQPIAAMRHAVWNSYREPFKTRRCIVPATGYIEFTGPKGDKIAHLFTRTDGKPIALGGLVSLASSDIRPNTRCHLHTGIPSGTQRVGNRRNGLLRYLIPRQEYRRGFQAVDYALNHHVNFAAELALRCVH